MTDERLKEIEALVNAATPGPWETEWDQCDPYSIISPKGIIFGLSDWEDSVAILSDCKFVSAAREIVPELLAEVRRLRELSRCLAEWVNYESGTMVIDERVKGAASEILRRTGDLAGSRRP